VPKVAIIPIRSILLPVILISIHCIT